MALRKGHPLLGSVGRDNAFNSQGNYMNELLSVLVADLFTVGAFVEKRAQNIILGDSSNKCPRLRSFLLQYPPSIYVKIAP